MDPVEERGVRRQAGTATKLDRASRTAAFLLVVASLLAACAARREASVIATPPSSCMPPRGVESWTERRQPPVGATEREGPAIVEVRVLADSLGPNFPHRHAVVSLRSTDGGRWGQGQVDTTGYVWMSVAPGRYAAAVRSIGAVTAQRTVEVMSGERVKLEVRLRRSGLCVEEAHVGIMEVP